jgi:hypothetical protein
MMGVEAKESRRLWRELRRRFKEMQTTVWACPHYEPRGSIYAFLHPGSS